MMDCTRRCTSRLEWRLERESVKQVLILGGQATVADVPAPSASPRNVLRVVQMIKDEGIKHTMDRVRGKLAFGSATGYSAAGEVIAVGSDVVGFRVGDRVACA